MVRPNATAFEREIASRFGLAPNFFTSAPDAPEMIERLWDFAKSAYLDNPKPSLFKERLFVYLSRFCEVRYCVFIALSWSGTDIPHATPPHSLCRSHKPLDFLRPFSLAAKS